MALLTHGSTGQRRDSGTQTGVEPDRRARILWGLACSLVVLAGYVLILVASPRFFYQDDTDGGAVPIWIDVGTSLRNGDLPLLEPGQWMAGNYAVEGQTGLFNPAQGLINLVAPSMDDLALYAAVVKLAFAIILAVGVYRTALEYDATPGWAAAAGAAMPFSGFTLYYDSASWVTGLMGSAWVAQAWASSVRYTKGRAGPLPAFAFLYLAVSVGYVHAAIMAGVLVACLMAAEALDRRRSSAVRLGLVGVSAALCGAITFLPGVLSAEVTWRGTISDPLQNDGFMSAAWSETLAMSLPSQLPAVAGFAGAVQRSPTTYVAWFVLPALAFVRWDRVARQLRTLAGPLLMLGASLLLTAGPSLLGPLRWPARLLPYVAMATLVVVAVLLTRYLVDRLSSARVVAAVALIGVNVIRASSANPDLLVRHVRTGAVVLVFTLVALGAFRLAGAATAAVWVMISTLPVIVLMVRWYPENSNVNQWDFPETRSEALAAFSDYPGSTLQLGSYSLVPRSERTIETAWGDLVFANYARFLQQDYVNAYTPVGFAAFSDLLCMDYAGSTCPEAFDRIFDTVESTDTRVVDLMAIDRVVLQRAMFPEVPGGEPPDGWLTVAENDQVIVLERGTSRPDAGSRVVLAQGVTVDSVLSSSGERDELTVQSSTGGRVVFSRLAWPGYEATLSGRPVPVEVVEDLFVAVDVPPTAEALLRLEYRPPGYRLGMLAAVGGLVLLGLVAALRRPHRELESANIERRPGVRASDSGAP